jgi:hypothetical protein
LEGGRGGGTDGQRGEQKSKGGGGGGKGSLDGVVTTAGAPSFWTFLTKARIFRSSFAGNASFAKEDDEVEVEDADEDAADEDADEDADDADKAEDVSPMARSALRLREPAVLPVRTVVDAETRPC